MVQKKSRPNIISVIEVQVLLCILCILAAAAIRLFFPKWFGVLQENFSLSFGQMSEEPEPVRFASRILDVFSISVQAETAAPEGCSLQSYLPKPDHVFPVQGAYVSSEYGWRVHPINGEKSFHNGIDLACAEGTPVVASSSGMIQSTGCDTLNGNYVIVRHDDGVVTSCCHMQFVFVRAGQFVTMGEQIGTVGQTGAATGPHLHFCLKHDGVRYDPAGMLFE